MTAAKIIVAVDAMGGDHAPNVVVQGALEAVREYGLEVILVGDGPTVETELARVGGSGDNIKVRHCTQVAGMAEHPTDVLRYKKDSSIRVAYDLVKTGQAGAAVSAGNTGASLAVGSVVLGRVKGVERPGIAGVFPTLRGPTVVIDIGANVDCKPSYLYQFGLMAEAYARDILGVAQPKVGLLSIGEEDSKGNELVRKAHELLRAGMPGFVGNVEGRDVFAGAVDVIVCDGFVGNVVLKLAEGMAEALGSMMKKELTADLVSRVGAMLARGSFRRVARKMDYAEFGGAPLLGLNGVGIISHGRSSPKAIKNAIRCAAEMVKAQVPARLQERLGQASPADV